MKDRKSSYTKISVLGFNCLNKNENVQKIEKKHGIYWPIRAFIIIKLHSFNNKSTILVINKTTIQTLRYTKGFFVITFNEFQVWPSYFKSRFLVIVTVREVLMSNICLLFLSSPFSLSTTVLFRFPNDSAVSM